MPPRHKKPFTLADVKNLLIQQLLHPPCSWKPNTIPDESISKSRDKNCLSIFKNQPSSCTQLCVSSHARPTRAHLRARGGKAKRYSIRGASRRGVMWPAYMYFLRCLPRFPSSEEASLTLCRCRESFSRSASFSRDVLMCHGVLHYPSALSQGEMVIETREMLPASSRDLMSDSALNFSIRFRLNIARVCSSSLFVAWENVRFGLAG